MQKEKQPKFNQLKVTCSTCNNHFMIGTVLSDVKVDICSACHSFYTGKQTGGVRAGRIERFNKKISKK